jgi:pyruvate dehydrogenase (quinone)
VPYADWARLLGLDGARIESSDQVDSVLDQAFAAQRPFVIDAVVDANIPRIPPHLTPGPAPEDRQAEFSGDPAFFGIVTEGVRETHVATVRGRAHRPGSAK